MQSYFNSAFCTHPLHYLWRDGERRIEMVPEEDGRVRGHAVFQRHAVREKTETPGIASAERTNALSRKLLFGKFKIPSPEPSFPD